MQTFTFTEEEIGVRSHWWHILLVVIPDNLNPAYATNATIWITDMDNEDSDGTGVPDRFNYNVILISTLATGIGMPFAALFQVGTIFETA